MTERQKEILKMFSPLTFDEERHLYYWKGVRVPLSVTGLVETHAPKFDEEAMLPYSAMKASRIENREVTVHELRKKWQNISQGACNLGTQVHRFMENYTGIETPRCPQEEAGIKYIKSLKGKYEVSFRELRAYSIKYNLAGTMDLPLRLVGKDEYIIDDYKTNGDLFKSYDNLYSPFDYLRSNAYNEYQIQLSLYQIILEEWKIKIVGRRLVHLKADSEFKVYDLLDLTGELREHMNKRKAVLKTTW